MTSSQEQFGSWWLHELVYGTEKQLQLNDFEATFKGKKPGEIIVQKDEYIKRESKLSVTVSQLQRLVASKIIISTIKAEAGYGIVAGIVERFDLAKGTITISDEDGQQTLPYCHIEPHEEYGRTIEPVVTMLADQEYRF